MELPETTPDTIGARQHPGVENHRQTNHTMPKNPVNALYAEFGWYRNDLKSFTFEGESGMRTMRSIMDSLRRDKPVSVGGYRVAEIVDYAAEGTGLPKANVLDFRFMNGAKLMGHPLQHRAENQNLPVRRGAQRGASRPPGERLLSRSFL